MTESILKEHLRNYVAAPNLLLNEKIKALKEEGEKIHNLAFGQSPFPVFDKAREELCKHAGIAEYLPIAGTASLRKEIAQFHAKTDELEFNYDNILVGPGTKQLSYLLFSIFNGDIMLPSPCWTTYPSQVQLTNKTPIIIETRFKNSWKISPQDLEEVITKSTSEHKLLVLINPDNPSGVCYSESELCQIAAVCRKYHVLILSDEIYGLFNFDDNHCTMSKCYPEGTILQSGISKWGSAGGWRLGYQIYPQELKALYEAVHKACSHTHSSPSAPVQFAAVEYFRYDDECQLYVQHCRRILEAVSNFCFKEFTSVGLEAVKPQGTFYMMIDFKVLKTYLKQRGIDTGVQLGELILKETKVGIMACGPAFLRPVTEFTFRVSYINFDGSAALSASKSIGLNTALDHVFVEEYCVDTVLAVKAISKWVQLALESKECKIHRES